MPLVGITGSIVTICAPPVIPQPGTNHPKLESKVDLSKARNSSPKSKTGPWTQIILMSAFSIKYTPKGRNIKSPCFPE